MGLSKKEIEEQRRREQEAAAAQAFEEYVATFQEAPGKTPHKVWVKAGTYDAGRRQEDTREKGKLYKPQSRFDPSKSSSQDQSPAHSSSSSDRDRKPDRPGKKKERDKKKSNLELFKEELKMIQEEREERHKYKGVMMMAMDDSPTAKSNPDEPLKFGSYDNGDPTTTNLYLGNLNPKISEQQLMEVFGRYGPLASIKIMWPRSDEEKARGRNCGFVAFMNRKDGERALKCLNGKDVMAYEMKLGWGKAVPIPPHPIYVPPALLELTMPPPPSGLPFNAQPCKKDRQKVAHIHPGDPYPMCEPEKSEMDDILSRAVVKVVIPTERALLMLIHRMIEFVIREGPMFEAVIMNRELNNPMFRFLFENQSPAHVYYRWKLYSLLQGDMQLRWRTEEFRMFRGGSIWKPPPMNPYTQGMPEELVEVEDNEPRKGTLSNTQRDRLEDILRNMTPEKMKVAEAMIFCIEHSEAAEEICECIAESLSILQTPLPKKIARLYLISDILHNCGVKITNVSYYRKGFESRLVDIFKDVRAAYMSLDSRLKAEGFKTRVMKIFRAWEEWAVYPRDFLIKLQSIFLGISCEETTKEEEKDSDLDGAPLPSSYLESEDLDGIPLDGIALVQSAYGNDVFNDIDGVPVADDLDGQPIEEDEDEKAKSLPAGFVPSKWETVDPEQVEAQAMTTNKWDLLENEDEKQEESINNKSAFGIVRDDSDGSQPYDSVSEQRRQRLREIELKVVQYQDELESGQRNLKSGYTITQQVEHYRHKLMHKANKSQKERQQLEKEQEDNSKDAREYENDREREKEKKKSHKRSLSPSSDSHHRKESGSTSKSHRRTGSRSRSKRSRSSSGSPSSSKRYRSASSSPESTASSRKHRRSRSPHSKKSFHSPSPPARSSKRRSSPASPSRIKYRDITPPRKERLSPPRSKGRTTSPRHKSRGSSPKRSKRH